MRLAAACEIIMIDRVRLAPANRFTQGEESMFDSLEERMKAEELEGTPKERMTRYIVIAAVSIVAIGAIILATEFLK